MAALSGKAPAPAPAVVAGQRKMEKRRPAREEAMELLAETGPPLAGRAKTPAAAAKERAAAAWGIVDLERCHALDIELWKHAVALEDKAARDALG